MLSDDGIFGYISPLVHYLLFLRAFLPVNEHVVDRTIPHHVQSRVFLAFLLRLRGVYGLIHKMHLVLV